MCFNRKVVAGLIAAAVAIYLIAPGSIGAALPLLLFAACPLSMWLMMRTMSGGRSHASPEPDAPAGPAIKDEVERLRAEVAKLRGSRDQPAPNPADPQTMGTTTARGPQ